MMSRFLQLLEGGRFGLIVALPANSVEMARAAEEGGADAIKVHLNITHRATKRTFGSLEAERAVLEEILEAVKIPVGLVPAAEKADRDEITAAAAMPFDFVDMFAHFMPAWLLGVGTWSRMAAADASFNEELLRGLGQVPGIHMAELALIPPEGYGQPLNVRDLALYRRAVEPAVEVPAEAVEPEEAAAPAPEAVEPEEAVDPEPGEAAEPEAVEPEGAAAPASEAPATGDAAAQVDAERMQAKIERVSLEKQPETNVGSADAVVRQLRLGVAQAVNDGDTQTAQQLAEALARLVA